MENELPSVTFKAIGTVRNGIRQAVKHNWQKVDSEIIIDPSLAESLDNLDEFSHIIVIYWLHHSATQDKLPAKVHPMGKQELPLVGRFATRSPHRPNPLGIATVRLLRRQGNILKVSGLDAINGTPVIDIKPYITGYDSPADATLPTWIQRKK